MRRKILFLSVLLLFGVGLMCAQQNISVSGIVSDAADGSPLVGVAIQLKGSSTGTVSDIDGRYSINVPQNSF